MKSSAHKALASLTHKYQQKICQLGRAYRLEDELVERIKNLESDLRMAKQVAVVAGTAAFKKEIGDRVGCESSKCAQTIERLEFDLRQANTMIKGIRGRTVYQEDFLAMEKQVKQLQNKNEALHISASKWESWACAYATLAIIASCAAAGVGYKYAVLTGLL